MVNLVFRFSITGKLIINPIFLPLSEVIPVCIVDSNWFLGALDCILINPANVFAPYTEDCGPRNISI